MAAEILEAHAITPLVVAEPAPTPAFAYAVIQTKADGVINFTASHNPRNTTASSFPLLMVARPCPKSPNASRPKSFPRTTLQTTQRRQQTRIPKKPGRLSIRNPCT
jgi:hypothetical protein